MLRRGHRDVFCSSVPCNRYLGICERKLVTFASAMRLEIFESAENGRTWVTRKGPSTRRLFVTAQVDISRKTWKKPDCRMLFFSEETQACLCRIFRTLLSDGREFWSSVALGGCKMGMPWHLRQDVDKRDICNQELDNATSCSSQEGFCLPWKVC